MAAGPAGDLLPTAGEVGHGCGLLCSKASGEQLLAFARLPLFAVPGQLDDGGMGASCSAGGTRHQDRHLPG